MLVLKHNRHNLISEKEVFEFILDKLPKPFSKSPVCEKKRQHSICIAMQNMQDLTQGEIVITNLPVDRLQFRQKFQVVYRNKHRNSQFLKW